MWKCWWNRIRVHIRIRRAIMIGTVRSRRSGTGTKMDWQRDSPWRSDAIPTSMRDWRRPHWFIVLYSHSLHTSTVVWTCGRPGYFELPGSKKTLLWAVPPFVSMVLAYRAVRVGLCVRSKSVCVRWRARMLLWRRACFHECACVLVNFSAFALQTCASVATKELKA